MCVDLFKYDISLIPIYNTIVGDTKVVFVFTFEPNGMFSYGNVLTSIPEPLQVVSDMMQQW